MAYLHVRHKLGGSHKCKKTTTASLQAILDISQHQCTKVAGLVAITFCHNGNNNNNNNNNPICKAPECQKTSVALNQRIA